MPKGIYAAASAMYTERRTLDVIAQNIANAQTPGYRRAEALRESFAETLARQGRDGDIAADGGAGIHEAGIWRNFAQGSSRETARELDFSLSGEGFFVVHDSDGEDLLTRAGHFMIDDQGRLTTPQGWLVQGQGGAIELPDEAVGFVVDEGGRIYAQVQGDNGIENQFIEQLRVAHVEDNERLIPRNGQYLEPGGQELFDAPAARVHQGRLENANIDSVTELVKMITVQRHFDAAQRAMRQQSQAGQNFSEIIHRA